MNTEDDLRATLRGHERLAPDPAPVAARVRAGVRARRRHRYAGTAAVAAATVAAVAVPTLVLRDTGADRPAGSAITTITAAAPRSGTPTPPAVRLDPLTQPFTVRWLPAGWFRDGSTDTDPGSVTQRFEKRDGTAEVSVQVWDTGSAAPNLLPTDGAPGVRLRLTSTLWLYADGQLPKADLERLARSVDVRAPRALRFPFRLTWLPAGYRLTGAGTGAHHWYGNGSNDHLLADPPLLDAGLSLDRNPRSDQPALNIGVSTENGTWQDKGVEPNGRLLGHPANYEAYNGGSRLHVYGVNGMHISIYADDRPELDRAALERIVTGLVLVDSPADPATWTTGPLP